MILDLAQSIVLGVSSLYHQSRPRRNCRRSQCTSDLSPWGTEMKIVTTVAAKCGKNAPRWEHWRWSGERSHSSARSDGFLTQDGCRSETNGHLAGESFVGSTQNPASSRPPVATQRKGPRFRFLWKLFLLLFCSTLLQAAETPAREPLSLQPGDVLPTGNEWIALPDIRASDGALTSFNVLSMHDRGLLQVTGEAGTPVLQPYFQAEGKPVPFLNPAWELIEYWTPTAHLTADGLEMTLTWCAPPGVRGAFLRMTLTNRRSDAVPVVLGLKASW
jgi:hypothetical protein